MSDPGKQALVTTAAGAQVEILGNPDYGTIEARIGPGQAIWVESGAMSYMSDGMEVKSRLMGGFFKALIRKIFGGESLFVGEYSHPKGGMLGISPGVPGKVLHRDLKGESVFLQAGSFLACSPKVHIGTQFGGLRAIFSGEGLFFLRCSGRGDLFFCAHGDVIERQVAGEFIVDTGHVVGWEETLDWTIGGMGGLKSTLFSGEGLVIRFKGHGKVWLQTRTEGGLAGWLTGYMF